MLINRPRAPTTRTAWTRRWACWRAHTSCPRARRFCTTARRSCAPRTTARPLWTPIHASSPRRRRTIRIANARAAAATKCRPASIDEGRGGDLRSAAGGGRTRPSGTRASARRPADGDRPRARQRGGRRDRRLANPGHRPMSRADIAGTRCALPGWTLVGAGVIAAGVAAALAWQAHQNQNQINQAIELKSPWNAGQQSAVRRRPARRDLGARARRGRRGGRGGRRRPADCLPSAAGHSRNGRRPDVARHDRLARLVRHFLTRCCECDPRPENIPAKTQNAPPRSVPQVECLPGQPSPVWERSAPCQVASRSITATAASRARRRKAARQTCPAWSSRARRPLRPAEHEDLPTPPSTRTPPQMPQRPMRRASTPKQAPPSRPRCCATTKLPDAPRFNPQEPGPTPLALEPPARRLAGLRLARPVRQGNDAHALDPTTPPT